MGNPKKERIMFWTIIASVVAVLAVFICLCGVIAILGAIFEGENIQIEILSENTVTDLTIYHCTFKHKKVEENRSYIVVNKSANIVYSHPDVGEISHSEKLALKGAWVSLDRSKMKRQTIDNIKRKLSPSNYRKSA